MKRKINDSVVCLKDILLQQILDDKVHKKLKTVFLLLITFNEFT